MSHYKMWIGIYLMLDWNRLQLDCNVGLKIITCHEPSSWIIALLPRELLINLYSLKIKLVDSSIKWLVVIVTVVNWLVSTCFNPQMNRVHDHPGHKTENARHFSISPYVLLCFHFWPLWMIHSPSFHQLFPGIFISMDWFKGKFTGNHRFSH